MPAEEDHPQRYLAAMHSVQSGVAAKMTVHPNEVDPKHLRTGVNSALINVSALANLLMKMGVITEEQYMQAIADGAEQEKARYEEWLSEYYGTAIQLG